MRGIKGLVTETSHLDANEVNDESVYSKVTIAVQFNSWNNLVFSFFLVHSLWYYYHTPKHRQGSKLTVNL